MFKSIECMLNRKPETRYPTCASGHHLAENFINLFTEKIDAIRSTVIADTLILLSRELTYFLPITTKKLSELVAFKEKCCELDLIPTWIMNLKCIFASRPSFTYVTYRG